MIAPMQRYLFLVHHAAYAPFLEGLRALGTVHVRLMERQGTAGLQDKQQLSSQLETALRALKKRAVKPLPPASVSIQAGQTAAATVLELQEQVERLSREREEWQKEYELWAPWGNFSKNSLAGLMQAGWQPHFLSFPEKHFGLPQAEALPLWHISQQGPDVLCFGLTRAGEQIDLPHAKQLPLPRAGTVELLEKLKEADEQIARAEQRLDELAATAQPAIAAALEDALDSLQILGLVHGSRQAADEHLRVLEGFVPVAQSGSVEAFCEEAQVVFLKGRPRPEDQPPIKLDNDGFTRLFVPIGQLFALPKYHSIDLTPYFAPFFLLFFGFCLGDAGYGLALLLGATVYKHLRAPKSLRPTLTLVQFLGVGTVLFGILTGTVFGLNLLQEEFAWLGEAKRFMLDSDQTFQLALGLGIVQMLFGLGIQMANKWRQFGWRYGLAPLGWIILIIGLLDLALFHALGPYSSYAAWAGAAFIVGFSEPEGSFFSRIGSGAWALYGITGLFGDLLSYIRLFALGIASAILGMVINSIALQIQGLGGAAGMILFVVFLLVGHTANLFIAALGAFVHPMRLTFVEFYKNAGFEGGGKAYRPLRKDFEIPSTKEI
ncbi:V-type ATP synthase subunit I [Phaeodactylibacter luteus]|nr:hypothetical protein [Phaeodactylibacter luteus]